MNVEGTGVVLGSGRSLLRRLDDAHGLVDHADALMGGHRDVEHHVAGPPAHVPGVVRVVRLATEAAEDDEAAMPVVMFRMLDGTLERLAAASCCWWMIRG